MEKILPRTGKVVVYIILWIGMGWTIAKRMFGNYGWAVALEKLEPSGKDQLLDCIIFSMPIVLGVMVTVFFAWLQKKRTCRKFGQCFLRELIWYFASFGMIYLALDVWIQFCGEY